MLKTAKRLYDAGFALHWLKSKSKMPIESGWTTGPKKTWKNLSGQYKTSFNLGVRLGEASKIGDEYLAVIDCDVKSTDPEHLKEMELKLKALLEVTAPTVMSGRGNGSRHLYVKTKEPVTPYRFAQSSHQVEVEMPSVRPSKKDLAQLGEKKCAKGLRLRPAWEISVMGEGQQVVLPPSIHPDSGKPYTWLRPFSLESLPLVEFEKRKRDKSTVTEESSLEFEEVDLFGVGLDDDTISLILKGDGAEDRSASLFRAARTMAVAGLTEKQILSVLTDRENFLGETGFDHAKTTRRTRAAKWVNDFTLKKVMKEISFDEIFGEIAVETPLDDEAAAKQKEKVLADTPDNGFYKETARGALVPLYGKLMKAFEKEKPFKTIADMKAVYVFNGLHYEDFTPIEIKAFCEAKMAPKPEEKIRSEFNSKVLANNVVRRDFFTESTKGLVNFKNGVLDLNWPDDGLMEHSPEYGFRGVLPYDYDAKATCPVFREWIDSVMLGDKQLVAILQEFMGYIVRGGDYKYHKALWLGGVGRNGKSTFVDLLKALIGVGNFSVISIKSLMQDKFAGASLDGKIANFSEETSPQELADSGPFKNLTGNGDISAQKKYGDPFSFRNRAKLIMTYNTIPDLKDLSAGMLSRPIIIPFNKIIGEKEMDHRIGQKLNAELSGIFNFALDGWDRLEKQGGFTRSSKSELALQRVKEESCSVYQFIEHYVKFEDENPRDPTHLIKPVELYQAYQKLERYPYKAIEFYRRLLNHSKMKSRHKHTRKGNFYWGVSFE